MIPNVHVSMTLHWLKSFYALDGTRVQPLFHMAAALN